MDTSKIDYYLCAGARDKNWYQDCQNVLINIFGENQLKIVCDLLAATSINSSLKSNIALFRRAYYEYLNGLPVGDYLPVMKKQILRVRFGEPISGRKITSFSKAMQGDENAVVVDIWKLRAFKINNRYKRNNGLMREGGASNKQYTLIEDYIRKEAPKHDLKPVEMSAMIWSGIRSTEGNDPQTRYTDILKKDYLESLFPINFKE